MEGKGGFLLGLASSSSSSSSAAAAAVILWRGSMASSVSLRQEEEIRER